MGRLPVLSVVPPLLPDSALLAADLPVPALMVDESALE